MTSNLALVLSTGVSSVGSYNDGTTFTWTPTSCGSNGTCPMNGDTRAGNSTYYYNWYAATAGEGKSTDADNDVDGSICPAGWKLPQAYTVNPNKSFGSLTNAYNFTIDGVNNNENHAAALNSFPFNFTRSGYSSYGSGFSNYGEYALYPSSTTGGAGYTAAFSYSTTRTVSQGGGGKTYGFTTRCVAI